MIYAKLNKTSLRFFSLKMKHLEKITKKNPRGIVKKKKFC